jgi:hypothetical protein|tara:strand:+ start:22 stop:291 length:270 start_codon:yes stop_codon:yes gene_type:complete
MSVWDDNFDEDLDEDDFQAWLDSVNESGDPAMDEHYYNKVQAEEWDKWIDSLPDSADSQAEQEAEYMSQAEYPERMVKGKYYIMTVSNN